MIDSRDLLVIGRDGGGEDVLIWQPSLSVWGEKELVKSKNRVGGKVDKSDVDGSSLTNKDNFQRSRSD